MYESKNSYYIRLSIPGVRKEDIRISLTSETQMDIRGIVKRLGIKEEFKKCLIQEIYHGPFFRRIEFSSKVDKDRIKFSYNRGILEINIPKKITD